MILMGGMVKFTKDEKHGKNCGARYEIMQQNVKVLIRRE